MKRVFLLGYPLAYSISPAMHNAAFRAINLDWQYELLETATQGLPNAIARLKEADCAGANVTIPHKQSVLQFLDDVSATARAIGAVNTIIHREGKLIGDNTDGIGFIASLRESHINPRNARVVILGAGGAARAVAFALAEAGAREIVLLNRTATRVIVLADHLHAQFPKLRIVVNHREAIGQTNILVNATSVGMFPRVTETPMPKGQTLSPSTVVVDLVYNPLQTRFLWDAKREGAWTINGLGMLVHQGVASFKLWTGRDVPVDVMRQTALEALRKTEYAIRDT